MMGCKEISDEDQMSNQLIKKKKGKFINNENKFK